MKKNTVAWDMRMKTPWNEHDDIGSVHSNSTIRGEEVMNGAAKGSRFTLVLGLTLWLIVFVSTATAASTPINYGDSFEASIDMVAEIDAYTLHGDVGDVVVIRMVEISSSLEPRVELYEPGGGRIGMDWDYSSARVDTVALSVSGTYTILAMDQDGDETGGYGLSLQRVFSPPGAVVLAYNSTVQDTLVCVSEMVAYTFEGELGDVVVIRMAEISSALEPCIELYDPLGNRKASSWGYSLARIDTVTLSMTGTYTILTMDDDGKDKGSYSTCLQIVSTVVDESEKASFPIGFSLSQNYPNPFNPLTKIAFFVPERSDITLKVYNSLGQEVATVVDELVPAGWHKVDFAAHHLASGIYVYQLRADEYAETRKMMVIK